MDNIEKLTEMQRKNNVIKMDAPWKRQLQLVQSGPREGAIKSSRFNINLILNNDENLKDTMRLNLFSGHNEVNKKPIWRRKNDDEILWTDTDEANLRIYLENEYGVGNRSGMEDCLKTTFYNNAYHPIRDYLSSLSWDGGKRVNTFFIDFLGADNTTYTQTVTRKMLVAAVARVFEPGVKFDNALILLGQQGAGKSHVLSRLGGEWFNESLNSFSGDEAMMKLRDSWIIELAELSALKASEVEEAKGFISARVDTYRPKYGRNIARFPRQCVFFGSTNNFEFLKDKTGNRRFWPLPIDKDNRYHDPFKELTDEYVHQVWAEAFHMYHQGEPLHLEDESMRKHAEMLQEEHTADDGMAGVIEEYLKGEIAVCARQIWFDALGNDKQPKRHDISDINQIMRSFDGWEEKRDRFGRYGQQRGFIRSD